jgi:hypothetical protein
MLLIDVESDVFFFFFFSSMIIEVAVKESRSELDAALGRGEEDQAQKFLEEADTMKKMVCISFLSVCYSLHFISFPLPSL